MYKRPSFSKEKKVIEEIINKCSFCKVNDAVATLGNLHYCSNNDCSTKLWQKIKI